MSSLQEVVDLDRRQVALRHRPGQPDHSRRRECQAPSVADTAAAASPHILPVLLLLLLLICVRVYVMLGYARDEGVTCVPAPPVLLVYVMFAAR